jgi:F-type H+-transporting ATPase subunit b
MRIRQFPFRPSNARRLVAAGMLATGVVVVAQSPAFAEDPGKKAGKELVECVEEALADNAGAIEKKDYEGFENQLEDCKKAPGLISPALPELIWGSIAFAVVAFALMKFAFPAIKKSLAARQEKIRNDLEAAETARDEAEEERAQYEGKLAEARTEANRIIEEARQAAEGVRGDLIAKAEADATGVRARAQDEARLAQERAMADLRARVTDLSIELAEKIVERNLDADTQRALVDSYISSVGNGQR